MAKGKKTSSEDKAKVITAKIKNPDLSLRDIEKQTGVKKSTTKDILDRDLPEVRTSSDKVASLVDSNIEILNIGKEIILSELTKIKNQDGVLIEKVSDIRQLSATLEDSFKQNQLLQDKPTENVAINDYKNLSTAELLKRKQEKQVG